MRASCRIVLGNFPIFCKSTGLMAFYAVLQLALRVPSTERSTGKSRVPLTDCSGTPRFGLWLELVNAGRFNYACRLV